MDKYYSYATRRLTNKKIGTVITGRGCPYQCIFCSHNRTIFKSKIRLRSAKSVVDEMEYLVDRYDVGEFNILDDSFTIDVERSIEICRLIRKKRLNILWSCNSRVDRAIDNLYDELSAAGCRWILFGAESGSQPILDYLKKNITLQQIEDSIKLCKKYRMTSMCSFMLGCPGETNETIAETLRFVKKVNPDLVLYCIFTPLPGSAIFDNAVAKGLIDTSSENWDNYKSALSTMPPAVNMSRLSNKELVHWLKKGFREFYLNPRYILKNLKSIRSFERLFELWRGFKAITYHQLHQFNFDNNQN